MVNVFVLSFITALRSIKYRRIHLLKVCAIASLLLLSACESAKSNAISSTDEDREGSGGEVTSNPLGSCDYNNLFSSAPECRNYTGSGWTLDSARSDCAAQADNTFLEQACDESLSLGTCSISSDEGLGYDIILAGEAPSGTGADAC